MTTQSATEMDPTTRYSAYGFRQGDFALLGDASRREIIEHAHTIALMMNEAREMTTQSATGPDVITSVKNSEGLAQFIGATNKPLAQITDAAAELLLEAHVTGTRFGVELGGLFDKATARELEDEGLGRVVLECETHGRCSLRPDYCRDCNRSDLYQVFVINDAGEEWLEDAGRI